MAYPTSGIRPTRCRCARSASGEIGLYDALDPTDGGNSSRFSLSSRFAADRRYRRVARQRLCRQAARSTCSTTSPTSCPIRTTATSSISMTTALLIGRQRLAQLQLARSAACGEETTFGLQSRYDDMTVGLTNTVQRQFLSNIRTDLREGRQRRHLRPEHHPLDRLAAHHRRLARRPLSGERQLDLTIAANSGKPNAGIGSPKFSMVFGPFTRTELFVSAGYGFHSNDVRGVTITEEPGDPTQKLDRLAVPGAHQGRRDRRAHQDSCPASTARSACSARSGLGDWCSPATPATPRRAGRADASASNSPTTIVRCSWLAIDADLAMTRARFVGFDQRSRPTSTTRSPASRRRRSAMRPATTFPARRTWSRPPASRLARRPAGSAR